MPESFSSFSELFAGNSSRFAREGDFASAQFAFPGPRFSQIASARYAGEKTQGTIFYEPPSANLFCELRRFKDGRPQFARPPQALISLESSKALPFNACTTSHCFGIRQAKEEST